MHSIRKVWSNIAVGLLALLATTAGAQDFNQLKGNAAKTGKNGAPLTSGPGVAGLTWFTPNGVERGLRSVRNNPSSATARNPVGAWNGGPIGGEASYTYIAARSTNAAYDLILGVEGRTNWPSYEYAVNTPSTSGSHLDPRQGSTAQFTWTIDPSVENPAAQSGFYGLYVWLPNGPTTVGGVFRYPQRYVVYEIKWGDPANQRTYIDVVDREFAGQGWVRLGNGGTPTNRVFPWRPGQPFQITLHNTIWRDQFNNLLDPNGYLVYADAAMAAPENGSYVASPIVGQITTTVGLRTQTIGANNRTSGVVESSGLVRTVVQPEVTAYAHNTGAKLWRWSPTDILPLSATLDNDAGPPQVTASGGWTSENVTNHQGTDYLTSIIQNTDAINPERVAYTPSSLTEEGDYLVQIYVGGDSGTSLFGRETLIKVFEGAAETDLTIDQRVPGWVTISNRRFHHDPVNAPLTVQITNYSANPADVGARSFADSVRFVGGYNNGVEATPIQTRIWVNLSDGSRAERDVVIVAAEDGRLYCLDAEGTAGGTTTVYWAYPSVLPEGVTDPNSAPTADGGSAEMPTGFGLSSPTIVRVNANEDRLYIAAKNGRVYCIDPSGRGDYNFNTARIGTAARQWSWPNDFPAIKQRPLGQVEGTAFLGSVAVEQTTQGWTVFVPAMEGRMYALDAIGNANKTTSVRWNYPGRTQDTLGPVTTTPAVAGGRVFFGTARKDDNSNGQFYSLNANTGAFVWNFEGTATSPADDFLGGPTYATAAELGSVPGVPDMVYCSNQNRFIYGLNAADGTLLWNTDELSAGYRGTLTFTWMLVPNVLGANAPFPIIMAPVEDGRFEGLFARPGDLNIDGTKFAYGYIADSDRVTASIAVGHNFMYGADESGYLYAFSNFVGVPISGGNPPGIQEIPPNDPAGQVYRNAKIAFITRGMYQRLRESPNAATPDMGNATYPEAIASIIPTPPGRLPAFEWGQTVYMMVYDFPFDEAEGPPVINFSISVEGASIRQFGVPAKYFITPPDPANGKGYAILAFPIQGSGPSSLPPGNARIAFNISGPAVVTAGGQPAVVRLNPNTSQIGFTVANPLGLVMQNPFNGNYDASRGFGISTDPTNPERNSNGSRSVAGGRDGTRLGNSQGEVSHGQTGTSNLWAIDMSMLTLLKGETRGLDAVRMTRNDLTWQGGAAQVLKPFDTLTFPIYTNLEDLPVNFPNTSLDYPNIGRDAIRVTKDPFGTPENPIVGPSGVSLKPPTGFLPDNELTFQGRTVQPVLFQLDVDVPRYQPAHNRNYFNSNPAVDPYFLDIMGARIPSGYSGRLSVYVDSNNNGQLDSISGRREAFRSFTANTAVTADQRLAVVTPVVDLGSIASGSLYSPVYPGQNSPISASPWLLGAATYPGGVPTTNNSLYSSLFQTFRVQNLGNVNMLNVRLAKATAGPASVFPGPWPIYSNTVDEMGWIDSSLYAWSDIDETFSLLPRPIIQKARVGDVTPTELSTNPIVRDNANLGVITQKLLPAGPDPAAPRIAIAPPIGTPVGEYAQRMHVYEEGWDARNMLPLAINQTLNMDLNGPIETLSEPGFQFKFTIRETRATTDVTRRTISMIDYPQASANAQKTTYTNLQPAGLRTLSGDLLMAFTSDRPAFDAAHPTDTVVDSPYRIYLSGLQGAPAANNQVPPLRELGQWTAAQNDRWFRQVAGPIPAAPFEPYFGVNAGETLLANTVKFGGAALPTNGILNPLAVNPTSMNSATLAFIGTAQKQSADGRSNENRLMAANVRPSGGGNFTVDTPVSMPYDTQMPKGRPSLYQVPTGSAIFYASTGTSDGGIFFTTLVNGVFTQPSQVNVGSGFESVGAPSVSIRSMFDAATNSNRNVVELAFSGKLRGRSNSEVFYGRMTTRNNGSMANAPGQLEFLPVRSGEVLTNEGGGVFRSQGVVWNIRGTINVEQWSGATNQGSLIDTSVAPTVERQTGLIRVKSRLGGDIYFDPNLGTVRFAGSTPVRGTQLRLTYQPRFLRVSESNAAAHSAPSLLFDNRTAGDTSEYSYWFTVNSSGTLNNYVANSSTPLPRPARFFYTYNRGAAGTEGAARPFWKSMRIGIQLENEIATDRDGNIVGLSISPAPSGPIQVDAPHGRIYFPAGDQGRTFQINYTAMLSNRQTQVLSGSYTTDLVVERNEQPIPLDQAVNDYALTPFLDPFDGNGPRPGLVWMYFVSSRAGGADIYFQTMAPRFTPAITGR